MSGRWTRLAAGMLCGVVASLASSAGALTFPLNPGDRIRDIVFSSTGSTLSYDGAGEYLTVTSQATRIELCGDPDCNTTGATIELDQPDNQVLLTLEVQLAEDTLYVSDPPDAPTGNGTITGSYHHPLAGDFTIIDLLDTGGPTVLLAAEFVGLGVTLQITELANVLTGSLQSDYALQAGVGDPAFEDALSLTGSLWVPFSSIQRSGTPLTEVCDIADAGAPNPACNPDQVLIPTLWAGLQSFQADPVLDLTMPAPMDDDRVFTAVTQTAGISYVQNVNTDAQRRMTGGAAACDFNLDGNVDIYASRHDLPDILYLGDGFGNFVDGTAAAFPGGTPLPSNGVGCADIDNDGDQDLMVVTYYDTRYYLYVNDGTGVFSEDAVARGVAFDLGGTLTYGTSVGFGDYDRDGWVDMYLGEWRWDSFEPPGTPNRAALLRNQGASAPGHFQDVTAFAGVGREPADAGVFRFSPAFVDMDLDGWPDLVIAADFFSSKIFWNDHDGTFTDGTAVAGVGTESNGMGSTIGDFDGDGLFDWYVTSIDQPTVLPEQNGNRLWRNLGDRTFADVTDVAGVRHGFFGWGTGFIDFDNDGDLDLVETNGMLGNTLGQTPMRVWDNIGGVFPELSARVRVEDVRHGKGLMLADFNRDGHQDVFVVNNGEQPILYRNDCYGNRHLRINLQGVQSNRDGLGALVRMWETPGGTPRIAAMGAGSHYLAQSERTLHFGLGPGDENAIVHVQVNWPSGIVQEADLSVNGTHLLVEAASTVPSVPRWGLVLLGLLLMAPVVAVTRLSRT